MKKWLCLVLVILLGAGAPFSWNRYHRRQALVFVHVDSSLPEHCFHAIYQARNLHRKKQIYCVAKKELIRSLPKKYAKICRFIAVEEIPKTKQHQIFEASWTNGDPHFVKGYYYSLMDRYFITYDLMRWKGLRGVFLIEDDVLLFDNLFQLIPKLRKKGCWVALPFERDQAFPTVTYVQHHRALKPLLGPLKNLGRKGATDNEVFSTLWLEKEKYRMGSLSAFGIFDAGDKANLLTKGNSKSRLYPYLTESQGRIVWIREKGQSLFVPLYQEKREPAKKLFSLHVQSKQLHWIRERYTQ